MSRNRLGLMVVVVVGLAALGGTLAARWANRHAQPTRIDRPASTNPFAFVLAHPPIVCHDPNVPVVFQVVVTNPLNEVVKFQNFGCDCGCTSGRLDLQELQPSQSALVQMTVNLSGREGAQRFGCHWNDESGRRWSAEARVTIYRPRQFEPGLVRLGVVEPGDCIRRRVHFDEFATTADDLPPAAEFSTSSIHRDPVQLGISPPVIESLGVGLIRRRTSVDVSFTVVNRGGYGELFLVPTTPGAGQPTPSLRLDWSVRETVELSPVRVALTVETTAEDRQTQTVCVRSLKGDALVIDRFTSTDPAIQVRLGRCLSDRDAEVEITVTLPKGKQFLAGDVVLAIGAFEAREVRIPVTAVRVALRAEDRP